MLKMKEKRTEHTSARIKPSAKDIMENSKYSYADAIEWFAYNIANKKKSKQMELKMLNAEIRRHENEIAFKTLEAQQIADELGVDLNDDEIYADEIKNSIQTTLQLFAKESSKVSIEDFVNFKASYIKRHADKCNLELEEMQKRIIDAHYKESKQSKLEI